VGEVLLPVNIAAAHEGLHSPYTSLLCHPLLKRHIIKVVRS